MFRLQIPKKLHLIWIGDELKRPVACLETWHRNHPDWAVKVWGNDELRSMNWINRHYMDVFEKRGHWAGVADLMRYEIVFREGGVYADADSFSLRPLQDWLLEGEMFAAWEDTFSRSRLINNAFFGSIPDNPFLKYVIETIRDKKQVDTRWSWSRLRRVRVGVWRSVGPYHLTRCIRTYNTTGYNNISVLPSHMFSPTHFRGNAYRGDGIVFADHQWGTTKKLYDGATLQNPIMTNGVMKETSGMANVTGAITS